MARGWGLSEGGFSEGDLRLHCSRNLKPNKIFSFFYVKHMFEVETSVYRKRFTRVLKVTPSLTLKPSKKRKGIYSLIPRFLSGGNQYSYRLVVLSDFYWNNSHGSLRCRFSLGKLSNHVHFCRLGHVVSPSTWIWNLSRDGNTARKKSVFFEAHDVGNKKKCEFHFSIVALLAFYGRERRVHISDSTGGSHDDGVADVRRFSWGRERESPKEREKRCYAWITRSDQ